MSNRSLVSILLVSSTWVVFAGNARADEVIYRRVRTIAADGTSKDEVVGSPIVRTRSGEEYTVGPERLEDPDGSVYGIDWDVGQDSEAGPLTLTTVVTRMDVQQLSDEDIVATWRASESEPSDEAEKAFRETLTHVKEIRTSRTVETALLEELETLGDEEPIVVLVVLDEATTRLPTVATGLLDTDPVMVLDQLEARLVAIEDRKTEVALAQKAVQAELEAVGGAVLSSDWTINSLTAIVPARTARDLTEDERFIRVERSLGGDIDSNDGQEVRDATQVTQFLTAGFDGEHPSGMSQADDMAVVIIDLYIDRDHPAWNDTSSGVLSTRLNDVWRWRDSDADGDSEWDTLGISEASADGTHPQEGHGTAVAGILVGDLFDNQDPLVTSPVDQAQRSGNATEASFDFIEVPGADESLGLALSKAAQLGPDVTSMSISCGACDACDMNYAMVRSVDWLYLNDIAIVNTPGNDEDPDNPACEVLPPATAAGSFTPGFYKHNGVPILNEARLGGGSPATTWQTVGNEPQVKRLTFDSSVGGHTVELKVLGTFVNPSTDNAYNGLASNRYVHIAMYWEDDDSPRDDADGPTSEIQ